MIISHKYKFIFIAVPKTGTHSVRSALRKSLISTDEEQVWYDEHKSKLLNSALARLPHGHISCNQAVKELDQKMWSSYFKFAFVRNPYDRFVSAAFFCEPNNPVLMRHPNLHLKKLCMFPESRDKMAYLNQTYFLANRNNELMVDFVGNTSTMQDDFNYISKQIGLPLYELNQLNTSTHKNYADYYDEDLRKLVHKVYLRDFKLLNFDHELSR